MKFNCESQLATCQSASYRYFTRPGASMVTEQLGRDSPLQAGSHTISHVAQDTDKKWRISRLLLGQFG